MVSTRISVFLLLSLSALSITPSVIQAMHLPSHIPTSSDWQVGERAPQGAMTKFWWVFPMRNEDWLKKKFEAVSDPKSPEYGHFLTKDQINNMTASDPALVQPVIDWMLSNNISQSEIEINSENAIVTTSVGNVERLFHTKMYEYHRVNQTGHHGDRVIYRTPHGIEIPDDLKPSLSLLLNVIDLPPKIHHGPIMRGAVRAPVHKIEVTVPGEETSHSTHRSSNQPVDQTIDQGHQSQSTQHSHHEPRIDSASKSSDQSDDYAQGDSQSHGSVSIPVRVVHHSQNYDRPDERRE